MHSHVRHPHAQANGFKATDVAHAYNLPAGDGTGVTVGVIELGGAVNSSDLTAIGADPNKVTVVPVAGGAPKSDGPNGADGEVALDVQVIAQVAPGSKQRVYFAPNTDAGFCAAIQQAVTECDVVSISWGGPESSWQQASVARFEAVFAAARTKGVPVFAAAGDAGSRDGTRVNTADYPASSPNVIGCGGTRLTLNVDGSRAAEVVWNDNPTNDATGGGVSKLFPGRTVPDVAGNADPVTGYTVTVDGQTGVIGGTSAVAPLYAACFAVVKALYGKGFDLLNTVVTNPTICFDVTQGNNGGYVAGPGKDNVSGYGVVDWAKLLTVLTSGVQVPAPGGNPTPAPVPTPSPTPTPDPDAAFEKALRNFIVQAATWLQTKGSA